MSFRLRTVLVFALVLAGLHTIYQADRRLLQGRVIDVPFTHLVTLSAGTVGQWFLPLQAEHHDDRLTAQAPGAPPATVVIRGGCNGIEALFLLLAGVVAVPSNWRRRMRALVCCLPLLFTLNLARILALLTTVAYRPGWVDVAHDQIAQGVMVVVVLALWIRYVEATRALAVTDVR